MQNFSEDLLEKSRIALEKLHDPEKFLPKHTGKDGIAVDGSG